jgi:hypothetical protein
MNAARTIRRLTVVALVPLGSWTVACGGPRPLSLPGRGGTSREPTGARGPRSSIPSELAAKKVAGKEAPVTLIAVDGSRCPVTEGRFRDTPIGATVLCAWY